MHKIQSTKGLCSDVGILYLMQSYLFYLDRYLQYCLFMKRAIFSDLLDRAHLNNIPMISLTTRRRDPYMFRVRFFKDICSLLEKTFLPEVCCGLP